MKMSRCTRTCLGSYLGNVNQNNISSFMVDTVVYLLYHCIGFYKARKLFLETTKTILPRHVPDMNFLKAVAVETPVLIQNTGCIPSVPATGHITAFTKHRLHLWFSDNRTYNCCTINRLHHCFSENRADNCLIKKKTGYIIAFQRTGQMTAFTKKSRLLHCFSENR